MSKWNPRANEIFCNALEIESVSARQAYLNQNCSGDSALRVVVEALLQAHADATSFLQHPAKGLSGAIHCSSNGDEQIVAPTIGQMSEKAGKDQMSRNSVLHSLREKMSQVPKVALREPVEGCEDPIVMPHASGVPNEAVAGRYRFDGEIARGGMGAIIKGRDTDLGRDLAIKILLDSHKENPEMVQRFVEEAQIGGQLQHPGIAPVFELGQLNDERPFFSMKLVKGKTLAVMLTERKNVDDDRAKYLSIFEQMCQTMAYAHSRGVIHRDLKPANIMVGSFGEVQVMDWGLAKVLTTGGVADEKKAFDDLHPKSVIRTIRSSEQDTPVQIGSETRMGSVMGTPAYMAPEQAVGEVHQLDERADVFGLGAILCEIITGKPPYVGKDHVDVIQLAHKADLKECMQRLNDCRADPTLLDIVRHCLAIEPADRYRSATFLADEIKEYLQSQEHRLRQAEINEAAEAARANEAVRTAEQETRARKEAQARATAETKRRRTTFALTASVIGLLVTAGIAGIWIQQERTRTANNRIRAANELAGIEKVNAAQEREAKETYQNLAYSSDMNRVALAYEVDNLKSARKILSQYQASEELSELRGFEWYFWDRKCNPASIELQGVPESFRRQFSPTNRDASANPNMQLISAVSSQGDPFELLIWNGQSGKRIRSIPLNQPEWNSVFYGKSFVSQDGQFVGVIPSFGSFREHRRQQRNRSPQQAKTLEAEIHTPVLRIWEVQTGEEVQSLVLDSEYVNGSSCTASFSPDNSKIAMVRYGGLKDKEGLLSVIDWKRKKRLCSISLAATRFQTDRPVFSPDGSSIALIAYADTTDSTMPRVSLFETNTGKEIGSLDGDPGSFLHQPVFHPDGSKIACGSTKHILLWDVASKRRLMTVPVPKGTARNIQFSNDGKRLVHFQDSSPTVRDATTGHELISLRGTGLILHHAFGFCNNDQQVKVVNLNGEVLTWAVPEPDTSRNLPLGTYHLCKNGNRYVIDPRLRYPRDVEQQASFNVLIVATKNRKVIQSISIATDSTHPKSGNFVLNADGTELASVCVSGDTQVVSFWNVDTGKQIRNRLRLGPTKVDSRILQIGFSPNGKQLMLVEYPRDVAKELTGLIRVVDLETGENVFSTLKKDAIARVQFSNRGEMLAILSRARGKKPGKPVDTIELLRIADSQSLRTLSGHHPVAFSSDDKMLAATIGTSPVIWNVESGKQVLTIDQQDLEQRYDESAFVFSPDGSRLFECRRDKGDSVLRSWNSRNGQLVFEQKSDARQLSFSPDGHRLVGLDDRQKLEVWDATPRNRN